MGLLAFLEPCTIATYSINSVRLYHATTSEKTVAIVQLFILKFLFLLVLFSLLIYLFDAMTISNLFIIYTLLVFASMFFLGKFIYFHIPHFEFFRLLPNSEKFSQSLKLSLSIPACNIPIIILLSFLVINTHSYGIAAWSAALFTFFYILPTLYFILRGSSSVSRQFLTSLGGFMPTFTSVLFLFISLYLVAGELSIDLYQLKQALSKPTTYAIIIGFITGFVFSFNPVSFSAIPMMLAYVVKGKDKDRALILGMSFIVGMLMTHILLGAIAALGGEWVKGIMGRHWGLILGPALIILGLIWSGIITIRLPWISSKGYKVASIGGAFLLAIPFSIAVCPFCTPALLVMLTSSAAIGSIGFGIALLGAFALGRSIPMAIGAISMSQLEKMRIFNLNQKYFEYLASIILIFVGLYMLNEYYFIIGY